MPFVTRYLSSVVTECNDNKKCSCFVTHYCSFVTDYCSFVTHYCSFVTDYCSFVTHYCSFVVILQSALI